MTGKNIYCRIKSGIILLLLFFAAGMNAQHKEAYNWYFGAYVGMTWNTTQTIGGLSGLPTPLPPSAMTSQQEGVFGMSDADGNLLFYSDGMTIWNRNHVIMLNGSGLTGGNSSAQSGIVIPYPGQPNLYIAMTLNIDLSNNLSYSIIDMTLDGGLGGVVVGQKNIQLSGHMGALGETVAAVRHSNGMDYWIAAPGRGLLPNAALNVWKVTTAGVQTTCVASYPLPVSANSSSASGYLRFSANGNYFAWPEQGSANLFFGTFDPATGTFSMIKVMNPGFTGYGVEFSLSSEILYAANYTTRAIHSWKFEDLLASPNPATEPSRVLPTGASNQTYPIQLGPDGRIYGAVYQTQEMYVIDNVDDYDNFTIHLVNGLLTPGPTNYQGRCGLPMYMAHYFASIDACTVFSDNIWYFGEMPGCTGSPGITFSDDGGGNVVASDASGVSQVCSRENSLSVSAPGCGESLIFYSQHNQLYNALHQPMLNGSFTGHTSVADGLAACYAGNNRYMLFAVNNAYEGGGNIGLDWHVIDMSGDNGLGEKVASGNIEPSGMAESIELVPVSGTTDQYWLIYRMRSTSLLRVRKITGESIGPAVDFSLSAYETTNAATYFLKANKNYNMLALLYAVAPGQILLLDFNPATGALSFKDQTTPSALGGNIYGLEISPNSRYLYTTNSISAMIAQYDIQTQLWSTPFQYDGTGGGGLKMGPDGKLYVRREGQYIGVIDDPDSPLTSGGYNQNGFDLGAAMATSTGLTFSTGLTPPAKCLTGTNTAPVAVEDTVRTCLGTPFCVNVLRNDYDSDPGDQIRLIGARFSDSNDALRLSIAYNSTDSTVCIAPDPGGIFTVGEEIDIIYTIKDDSGDPIPYCSEGTLTIVITEAYAPQMQSQAYIACPNAVVRIEIAAASQPGYIFKWYDASMGGNLLATGTYYDLVKDNNTVQSVWVESIPTVGSVCERTQVDVLLSDYCGGTEPVGCAATGTLLYKEDFRGNDPTDPVVSPVDLIGGRSDLIFNGVNPASGNYGLIKRNTTEAVFLYNDDHTCPNDRERGYFMYIDPAPSQMNAILYEYDILGLCSNTSKLSFTIWMADLQTANARPKVEMLILNENTGDTLVTSGTFMLPRQSPPGQNPSNPLIWRQYGFNFDLPAGVSDITFRLTNKEINYIGNDWAIDDIEIRLCVPPVIISGKADYCPGENINLTGSYTDDGAFGGGWQMRWLYSATGDLTSFAGWTEVATGTTLNQPVTAGFYRAVVGSQVNLDGGNYNCCAISDAVKVGVVPNLLYWKTSAPDSNWNEPANWADAADVVLDAVPRYCTDVHIPGNASAYPSLDVGNTIRTPLYDEPECHDIYFHFGGEVAKPHLLDYNKAFIEYNFGYFDNSSVYQTDGDSHSALPPMERGKWYALATPLNKITPGDFSFGGKPDAWQRGFIQTVHDGSFAGQWEIPHNANATNIPAEQYGGIAVWMADVVSGSIGEDASYHTNLNDLQGIIRIPYFEDAYLGAFQTGKHRIHEYVGGESRFYYYWNLDPDQPIEYSKYDAILRAGEAYRFVFDNNLPSTYISSAGDNFPTFKMAVPAGKELMIGNPFLSNLDFDAFYAINAGSLENDTYRLYANGGWGYHYSADGGSWPLTQYIAPLQAFFIQTSAGATELLFPPDLVSVTVPTNKLRAAGNRYNNVLYVEASNGEGSSWATLGMKTGTDVDYLFNNDPLYVNIPQIYVSDGNRKNAVQFISEETEIPLGIRSQSIGTITLRFNNVERFYAESLELQDKVSGDRYDLLLGTNEIEFSNLPDSPDRFLLKVGKQTVGTRETVKDAKVLMRTDRHKLLVESSEIIQQIAVMNMQGIYLLNNPFVNNTNVIIDLNVPPGIYIVKVMLENGENRVKKVVIE